MFLHFVAVFGALGTIGAIIFKSLRWIDRQKVQDEEIQDIKNELNVLCFGVLAALDGLRQGGANGMVTEAYKNLEKHLNKSAHK